MVEMDIRWRIHHSTGLQGLLTGTAGHPGAKILSKTRAPAKCKLFVWLALHDRCWTAARRKGHNLQDDDPCTLCGQESETTDHLLMSCCYSRQIWFTLLRKVHAGWLCPMPADGSLAAWWSGRRKQLHKD